MLSAGRERREQEEGGAGRNSGEQGEQGRGRKEGPEEEPALGLEHLGRSRRLVLPLGHSRAGCTPKGRVSSPPSSPSFPSQQRPQSPSLAHTKAKCPPSSEATEVAAATGQDLLWFLLRAAPPLTPGATATVKPPPAPRRQPSAPHPAPHASPGDAGPLRHGQGEAAPAQGFPIPGRPTSLIAPLP